MAFTFRQAVREATPLLIGVIGPTWTGKTYSALRLATGIVRVRGGNIVGIDTEARRMLQYANEFKFQYLEFGEPFSSLRYAEALIAAAKEAKGGCVIMDSMSHEHEGMGGYLDFHEHEVRRLCKDGGFKSEWAASIPAWNKPAQDRRRLINTLLQLNCTFVFCFRAKEKIKPVKGGNPIELGWQAIAGEEFGFEMSARCLLTPGAKGVPDWSAEAEKLGVPKRIKDHVPILRDGKQLDEDMGSALAQWAAGTSTNRPAASAPTPAPPSQEAEVGGVSAAQELIDLPDDLPFKPSAKPAKVTKEQAETLAKLCEEAGSDSDAILAKLDAMGWPDVDATWYAKLAAGFEKKIAAKQAV